jgi:hypothetical protein
MCKEFFLLFCDMLVLNMFLKYVALRVQAADNALVCGGKGRNLFRLKLVTLSICRLDFERRVITLTK